MTRFSLCDFSRARFANNRYFNFARELQPRRKLFDNIVARLCGAFVRRKLRVNDNAHLAARLNGKRLLNERKLHRDLFELFHALNVMFERLAPRARPRRAARVGRRDNKRIRIRQPRIFVIS